MLTILTPTYSVSVLAGSLGRMSMSMHEMVRLLHSVHLHTAGHGSTVSDAPPALARRLRSVHSAHAITCIAGADGWMASRPRAPALRRVCLRRAGDGSPGSCVRPLWSRKISKKKKTQKHLSIEFCWGTTCAGISQEEHCALWVRFAYRGRRSPGCCWTSVGFGGGLQSWRRVELSSCSVQSRHLIKKCILLFLNMKTWLMANVCKALQRCNFFIFIHFYVTWKKWPK